MALYIPIFSSCLLPRSRRLNVHGGNSWQRGRAQSVLQAGRGNCSLSLQIQLSISTSCAQVNVGKLNCFIQTCYLTFKKSPKYGKFCNFSSCFTFFSNLVSCSVIEYWTSNIMFLFKLIVWNIIFQTDVRLSIHSHFHNLRV